MNIRVMVSARKAGGPIWDARATGGVRWVRSVNPVPGFTPDDACERFAANVRERYPEHAFTFVRGDVR